MKRKSKLFGAIVLGGSLGLLANPVWVHAADNYMNDHFMSNQGSNYYDQNQQFNTFGLSNQQIRRVERKLKAEGFDPGRVDGVIDSQTHQALSEFQRENNIPVTGRINEQTADALGLNNLWNGNRYSSSNYNYYNNNQFSRNYNNEFSTNEIRQVQRALDREGYNPGQIDGQMDQQTHQALRQFQRDEGLTVTGRINQRTADRLGVNLQNNNNYNDQFSRNYNNGFASNSNSTNYNNEFSTNEIRKVQRALDREGYNPGQIDGQMDQQTHQALRQFQRDEGLAVTGMINQRTADRLGVNLQNNNNSQSSWNNWQSSSNNW